MTELRRLFQQHPAYLRDKMILKGLLSDLLPDQRIVQIMVNLYECGIVDKVRSSAGKLSRQDVYNLVQEQENRFGTSRKFTEDGIKLWAEALGAEIDGETSPQYAAVPQPAAVSSGVQHILPVFYVLDTSGSMMGDPVDALNRSMQACIRVLQNAERSENLDIRMAVLSYDSDVRWQNPTAMEPVSTLVWKDLKTGGLTEVGTALKELNRKLQLNAFLNFSEKTDAPIVIFMTDGYATDNYRYHLEQLRKNPIFMDAKKVGIAFNSSMGADRQMVQEVAGSAQKVVQVDDLDSFAKVLPALTESLVTGRKNEADAVRQVTAQIAGCQ